MQPLKVEVTNWKKAVLASLIVPFVHPVASLISDLFQGKPLAKSLTHFGVFSLIYLVIGLFIIARTLVSGRVRRIIADENGLGIQAGRNSRRIAWHQIATFERSMQATGKDLKRTLTLRDAGGAILAQIPRELQESAQTAAGFEALEARLVAKVGKRGLIAPSLDAPLTKTAFALKPSTHFIGWLTLAMFLPCAFLSWPAASGGALVGASFLGFALLGVVLILCGARYEIDESGVRSQTRFKVRELGWEEVRRVELARGATNLTFRGEKTAVTVSGPASWGKDGGTMMMFVLSQCEKFGIVWDGDHVTGWHDLLSKPKSR